MVQVTASNRTLMPNLNASPERTRGSKAVTRHLNAVLICSWALFRELWDGTVAQVPVEMAPTASRQTSRRTLLQQSVDRRFW